MKQENSQASNGRILVVDDEELTVQIIQLALEGAGFCVVTAENGQMALDILDANPDGFDVLIIDREMPVMGGMAVLERVRQHYQTVDLPVILQTSLSRPEQIREGIEAGAFYYVTKPYDEETLVTIVRSAMQRRIQAQAYQSLLSQGEGILAGVDFLKRGFFQFRCPSDAKAVIWMVAQHAEEPAMVMACLQELVSNAIEHGNLQIGGEIRTELQRQNSLEDEIARRLDLPEYADRYVTVEFDATGADLMVTVVDQGKGFDWQAYVNGAIEQGNKMLGRGIISAQAMSSHRLSYENDGRQVSVVFDGLQASSVSIF